MPEELRLPPHIENISGCFFNRLNNRWVGAYKIQKICDDYWAQQDNEYSPTILNPNGTLGFKTSKVIVTKPKFKKQKELIEDEAEIDYGIVENPLSEEDQLASDDIFVDSADSQETSFIEDPVTTEPAEIIAEFVSIEVAPEVPAASEEIEKPAKTAKLEGLSFYAKRNGVTRGYLRNLVKVNKLEFVDVDGKPFIDLKKYPSVIFEPVVWKDNKKKGQKIDSEVEPQYEVQDTVPVENIQQESTEVPQEIVNKKDEQVDNEHHELVLNKQEIHIEPQCPIVEAEIEVSGNWHDPDSLLTIKSAAKELNHTAAYIYQLLQKGSLDEVEVDGVKFVTKESVEKRKQGYVDQNARLRAEKASNAAREKSIKKMNSEDIITPFIEKIDLKEAGEKSDAILFFESPIYQNSVSFMWNIDKHEGLMQIISDVCKQWGVDFEYMRFKVRCETIPKYDDVWYEEIMAMVCHAIWIRLPIANRIDWLSGFLNRTSIQVTALLGIYYREMHTTKGNWYRWKENDSAWWEWATEFDRPLDDYFLPYYRFDYTYKYHNKRN